MAENTPDFDQDKDVSELDSKRKYKAGVRTRKRPSLSIYFLFNKILNFYPGKEGTMLLGKGR